MQDDNLPTTGAAGAIVLIAQAVKNLKDTALKRIVSEDSRLGVETQEGVVTLTLSDVASQSAVDRSIEQVNEANQAQSEDIDKLKSFVGYDEALDLKLKIQEILGE